MTSRAPSTSGQARWSTYINKALKFPNRNMGGVGASRYSHNLVGFLGVLNEGCCPPDPYQRRAGRGDLYAVLLLAHSF
jgi:hypothetical protein